MLENWLKPINPDTDLGIKKLAPSQMGNHLTIFQKNMPDLQNTQIAFLGVEEKEANAIRRELYRMSFPFAELQIADLGNLRKNDLAFLVAPLKELLNSQIFPIFLGNQVEYTTALYQAFLSHQQWISLVTIDEIIRFDLDQKRAPGLFLNEIIRNKSYKLFHLAHIGAQTHFISPSIFDQLEKLHFDNIRLGRARAEISELEPIIRDADLLSLNISALKQCEAPGQNHPTPSGFQVEDACQITRYAGMSDKLKAMGIFGFRKALDRKAQTAQAIAQMCWYFLDGFYHRKQDFPVSNEGLTEYIVDFKGLEYQLTFWKSNKSGRWWMQIPVKSSNKTHQRHRLIPCSYKDYKLACQEELPERLLHALKRFS